MLCRSVTFKNGCTSHSCSMRFFYTDSNQLSLQRNSGMATACPVKTPVPDNFAAAHLWTSLICFSLKIVCMSSTGTLEKNTKTQSIMWINPEITQVALWMIFCTWIICSGKTRVDFFSNWHKQLVKSLCLWLKQLKRNYRLLLVFPSGK